MEQGELIFDNAPMSMSADTSNIFSAIAKVQGSVAAAKMTGKNPHLGNRYATLSDVWDVLRPKMAEVGLAAVQWAETSRDGATLYMHTLVTHSSGEWMRGSAIGVPLQGQKGLNMAQTAGVIITYLRRYSLTAFFGIVPEEDTDGNGGGKVSSGARYGADARNGQNGEDLDNMTPAQRRAYEAKQKAGLVPDRKPQAGGGNEAPKPDAPKEGQGQAPAFNASPALVSEMSEAVARARGLEIDGATIKAAIAEACGAGPLEQFDDGRMGLAIEAVNGLSDAAEERAAIVEQDL